MAVKRNRNFSPESVVRMMGLAVMYGHLAGGTGDDSEGGFE
jgi:hypothetical protein